MVNQINYEMHTLSVYKIGVEYYLIKKATSKARRKWLLKTIGLAALMNVVAFAMMYGILDIILWLYYV